MENPRYLSIFTSLLLVPDNIIGLVLNSITPISLFLVYSLNSSYVGVHVHMICSAQGLEACMGSGMLRGSWTAFSAGGRTSACQPPLSSAAGPNLQGQLHLPAFLWASLYSLPFSNYIKGML